MFTFSVIPLRCAQRKQLRNDKERRERCDEWNLEFIQSSAVSFLPPRMDSLAHCDADNLENGFSRSYRRD